MHLTTPASLSMRLLCMSEKTDEALVILSGRAIYQTNLHII